MEFMESEVENEQIISLAQSGFQDVPSKAQAAKSQTTSRENQKLREGQKSSQNIQKKSDTSTAASLHVGENKFSCVFCEKSHQSHECSKALDMVMEDKQKSINKARACFTCLRKGHLSKDCKVFVNCTGCKKRHYHMMCPQLPNNKRKVEVKEEAVATTNVTSNQANTVTLLKTLRLNICKSPINKTVRVLLDDGSQKSYIKTDVARETRCLVVGNYLERNGLFGAVLSNIERRTIFQVPLRSLNGKYSREVQLSDTSAIARDIPKLPPGPWLQELKQKKIWINDCSNPEDEEIDILIGADLMPQLVTGKSIILNCGLQAVETLFGWTIMGPVPTPEGKQSYAMLTTILHSSHADISQLWNLELIGIRDPIKVKSSQEKERFARDHFLETVTQKENGRYVVSLPWIDGIQNIPNNYSVAVTRLIQATKKLKDVGKYHDYHGIFKLWLDEGFIEETNMNKDLCHYVPHRPVYKPESKTTPVRPVFDASCKTGRNPSLNECLEKGPNLIELIPAIIHRFRRGRIGVISNIRKAFQMIELVSCDQDFLRFLWGEDDTCTKIKIYKHVRVVFGVNCSPFILAAVLEHHLDNTPDEEREISEKMKISLYVDNCVTSVDSMEEYLQFRMKATEILLRAKFELRCWEYGPVDTSGIGSSTSEECGLDVGGVILQEDEETEVLGMKWNKLTDTLRCNTVPEIPEVITKRTLLSTVNKIYDLLGFLAPAMVFFKLMLQEAWGKKIDWDEALHKDTEARFLYGTKDLRLMEEVCIPRRMNGIEPGLRELNYQLHSFCDASSVAYASAVFLRVDSGEEVSVQLLQCKARVAPIQRPTIPRLELLGCVLQARLTHSIQEALQMEYPIFYWSDSTTALAWIKRNDEWGTFVGNRVKEICNLTNSQDWRHVPGKSNPADFPSRGCTPQELLESKWWEGSKWLKKPSSEWPVGELVINEEVVNQEKKLAIKVTSCKNVVGIVNDPSYAKRATYSSNVRVMAMMLRFIQKLRKLSEQKGRISPHEMVSAELKIFKLVQEDVFRGKSEKSVAWIQINKTDEYNQELLRVRTKIVNRDDYRNFQSPVLLPHLHPIVDRMIREEHIKSCHGGIQYVISKLREKVWIVKTRKAVRRVISGCVVCRRFRAKPPVIVTALLPENRVKDAKVFQIIGVDLAGPLHLKDGEKVYIVLFTCAVFRAIHLELVTTLNTDSFIMALHRFINRRGRPATIYSDNGTNFKGTSGLFARIDWEKVQEKTGILRIQWIFNPPSASWWGGFWERLIQSIKDLIKRTLGHSKLNYVEMETILVHVESVINGRPLTYVTEDTGDLVPLSPSVFFQDITLTEFPEIKELDGAGLRAKFKEFVQLKEELRTRFRSEYLGQLVQRSKANQLKVFKVGEVVLIANDNIKRLECPMAKIVDLIPGRDGVVRVETEFGELVRPIQRLIPLEVYSEDLSHEVTPEVYLRAKGEHRQQQFKEKIMDLVPKSTKKNLSEGEATSRTGRLIRKPLRFRFN